MNLKVIAPLTAYAVIATGLLLVQSAWFTLLGFHLAIILSLLIAKAKAPSMTGAIKWSVISVILCGSSGIGLYFFWDYLGTASDLPAQLESIGLTRSAWLPFIAYFALVNPFLEETFWRDWLGNASKGFTVNDAVYSGYHVLVLIGKTQIGSIVFAFIMLTLAGWFWRQTKRETNSLLPAILGHFAADLSILLTVFFYCSSFRLLTFDF